MKNKLTLLGVALTLWLASLACTAQDLADDIEIPEDIFVTKTEDSNDGCTEDDCSLREAIIHSNLLSGQQTIHVPAGTYVLTLHGAGEDETATGDLDITDFVIIQGAGRAETIIDGDAADRVFHNHPETYFEVNQVTIQNGAADRGGGIYNLSSIQVKDSIIRGNTAEVGGGLYNDPQPGRFTNTTSFFDTLIESNIASVDGGGIYSDSKSLGLQNTTLTNNSAGGFGGGIFNAQTVWIGDSTLQGNQAQSGGAVFNAAEAIVSSQRTRFEANQADELGGAVHNLGTGYFYFNMEFVGNTANQGGAVYSFVGRIQMGGITFLNNSAHEGGAVYNAFGTEIVVDDTDFEDNTAETFGGAVYNGQAATAFVSGSRFRSNSAQAGGAWYSLAGGETRFTRSIFGENQASDVGGAIYNVGSEMRVVRTTLFHNQAANAAAIYNGLEGDLRVNTSTISTNFATYQGGGIFNAGGTASVRNSTIFDSGINNLSGTVSIANTIVAGNDGGACSGAVISQGHNLKGDSTCGSMAPGDLIASDPGLGDPAWFSEMTLHPLEPTSPAIDAGDDSVCLIADQRGVTRPQDGNSDGLAVCDIGAFEYMDPVAIPFENATPTPTPLVLDESPPVVNGDVLCYMGPGSAYEVVSSVEAGTTVELLGVGENEGWLVIANPLYNVPCWVGEDDLDLDPDLDLNSLEVFPAPPLPTATFTPAPTITPTPAPSGTISGIVWKDNNGDGSQQGGEGGLANVTVHLGQGACSSTGFKTKNSAGSGGFSFNNLAPGTYCVSVSIPVTCQQFSAPTTATQYTVNLGAGENLSRVFGFQKKIC